MQGNNAHIIIIFSLNLYYYRCNERANNNYFIYDAIIGSYENDDY